MIATGASPFFLGSAEDLLRRLEALNTPEAEPLCAEARALIAIFTSWATNRPSDDDRVAGIGRLFELNRRAMDLMSKPRHPSGRP